MKKPLRHLVCAPSNIALIKYMGKSDALANLPENSSLSMTLDSLATWVSIEAGQLGGDFVLAPGAPDGSPSEARAPELSASGRDKVLKHCVRSREAAQKLLPELGLECAPFRDLVLRTGNTFPEAAGIASSASSFAAITLSVALASASEPGAFAKVWKDDVRLRRALARVSRQGSGSSCRSFEGPWVLWEGEDARALEAPLLPELAHFVLLVSRDTKSISSSEAHARVKSSPLWAGRLERVERRLALVRLALERADLAAVSRLAWSEAWEMHSLFHTAAEPFSYWKPGTIEALHWLAPFVSAKPAASSSDEPFECPPVVTMDAGPNVHVTVLASDAELWRARFIERFKDRFGAQCLLEDRPGQGARIVAL